MIDLVDYGGGNLGSISRCLQRLEVPYQIVDSQNLPSGKHPILLPGVGAFGAVMKNLEAGQLGQIIKQQVQAGTPYLGICVGMQILFDQSEESPGGSGLGLIPGQIVRYQQGKVPQIGWNEIQPAAETGLPSGYVYFVNSYYAQPVDFSTVLYQADYQGHFCAAVQQKHILACQFHPEKSGEFGLTLLRRWIDAL